MHPRAAAQGRCANTSQQASPPSPARDACTFKSSTSTRLSPYGCRTGYATRVPCTYPPGCRGNENCICVISMRIQGAYNDYYLSEPLESHREHEEPCSLRAPLLPRHVGSTHFLSIPIDVPNQRVVMHHETRRLPSSPVRCGVMTERKHVRPGVASSSKMARPQADRRGMGSSSWSTRGARGGRGVEGGAASRRGPAASETRRS